jgi:hypothetical protein
MEGDNTVGMGNNNDGLVVKSGENLRHSLEDMSSIVNSGLVLIVNVESLDLHRVNTKGLKSRLNGLEVLVVGSLAETGDENISVTTNVVVLGDKEGVENLLVNTLVSKRVEISSVDRSNSTLLTKSPTVDALTKVRRDLNKIIRIRSGVDAVKSSNRELNNTTNTRVVHVVSRRNLDGFILNLEESLRSILLVGVLIHHVLVIELLISISINIEVHINISVSLKESIIILLVAKSHRGKDGEGDQQ